MTQGDWTRDTPAPGLVVPQPRKGFRYGSEAFWLVGLATEDGVPATALDLGTGSGIMALLLARLGANVEAVDVRPEWRAGWDVAVAESALAGSVDFRTADVRDVAVAVLEVDDVEVQAVPAQQVGRAVVCIAGSDPPTAQVALDVPLGYREGPGVVSGQCH